MTNAMQQKMESLTSTQSGNKDLNAILRQTEAQTQSELASASERTQYLQEYMTLNNELTEKINGFLEANQTYSEKFKALLENKDSSTFGRFMRATPLVGRLFENSLQPSTVAEVLDDMYTNMILQKDAVAKQLGIIEARRESLFEASAQAETDMVEASTKYEAAKTTHTDLKNAKDIGIAIQDDMGKIGENSLEALLPYSAELGLNPADVQAGNIPERLDLTKLGPLVDSLEKQYTDADETLMKHETELNAAMSARKGYRVQKDQFNAYVKTTKALLFGLETHLKYSKEIVENQVILLNAQDTAIRAVQAYSQYQDAVNQTFVLNAVGVQVMATQTAEMLSRDMFDEASLDEARARVADADQYWDDFRDQYSNKAEALSQEIQASTQGSA